MGKVMRFQGGAAAVYTDPNPTAPSTLPLTSPLTNLDKIAFHSDLFYPLIVSSHTGSGTIPGMSTNTRNDQTLVTIAHGQGAAPLALGTITVSMNGTSYTYSLNGTVCVPNEDYHYTLGGLTPDGTVGPAGYEYIASAPALLTLSADGTNVYLECTQAAGGAPGGFYEEEGANVFPTTSPSVSFDYEIHILDLLSTQTSEPVGEVGTPMMELSPTRITMGQRKFDTDDKHIRSAVSGDDVIISGETIIATGAPIFATASTVNHTGNMGILARNLDTYCQFGTSLSAQTAGAYPTPTETKIKFP